MKAVRHLLITGLVQGVGFRFHMERKARELGVTGWVRNRRDGSVEAVFAGGPDVVRAVIEACRRGPRMAQVDAVDVDPVDLDILPEGFTQLPTA